MHLKILAVDTSQQRCQPFTEKVFSFKFFKFLEKTTFTRRSLKKTKTQTCACHPATVA